MERFAGDTDELAAAAAAIRRGEPLHDLGPTGVRGGPVSRDVEHSGVDAYELPPATAAHTVRREAQLTTRFVARLRAHGAKVSSRHYPVTVPPLRNDVFDETDRCLWEAKGDVSRSAVRMVVGQLLDCRRYERKPVHLGVLLPRQPSEDLAELICSASARIAWPDRDGGFVVLHPA